MSNSLERRLVWLLTIQAVVCMIMLGGLLLRALPQNTAMAQPVPVAGGGGVFMMPGQLAQNAHGLFVMDTELQNILVYQYDPSDKMLHLRAARNFAEDRKLRNHNTEPSPQQTRDLLLQQEEAEKRDAEPRPKAR